MAETHGREPVAHGWRVHALGDARKPQHLRGLADRHDQCLRNTLLDRHARDLRIELEEFERGRTYPAQGVVMERVVVEHHVAAELLAGLHEHVDFPHLLDAVLLAYLEAGHLR